MNDEYGKNSTKNCDWQEKCCNYSCTYGSYVILSIGGADCSGILRAGGWE